MVKIAKVHPIPKAYGDETENLKWTLIVNYKIYVRILQNVCKLVKQMFNGVQCVNIIIESKKILIFKFA